ncbi:MAG: hypothetical protein RSE24_03410 [Oscillospiraceae bacterium]
MPLVVVGKAQQGIVYGLWKRAEVNRPLGGVVFIKLHACFLCNMTAVLVCIVFYASIKIALSSFLAAVIVSPIIITLAVLLGKLPCDKRAGSGGVLGQCKAPVIVKEYRLRNLIISVFLYLHPMRHLRSVLAFAAPNRGNR